MSRLAQGSKSLLYRFPIIICWEKKVVYVEFRDNPLEANVKYSHLRRSTSDLKQISRDCLCDLLAARELTRLEIEMTDSSDGCQCKKKWGPIYVYSSFYSRDTLIQEWGGLPIPIKEDQQYTMLVKRPAQPVRPSFVCQGLQAAQAVKVPAGIQAAIPRIIFVRAHGWGLVRLYTPLIPFMYTNLWGLRKSHGK